MNKKSFFTLIFGISLIFISTVNFADEVQSDEPVYKDCANYPFNLGYKFQMDDDYFDIFVTSSTAVKFTDVYTIKDASEASKTQAQTLLDDLINSEMQQPDLLLKVINSSQDSGNKYQTIRYLNENKDYIQTKYKALIAKKPYLVFDQCKSDRKEVRVTLRYRLSMY